MYPEESLKRGGKAKKKRATVDKSIKISIRNVQKQQEQRDIVHLMQGRAPPTPNMMPNSSRVFSAPSIHYAYAPPQYYGNAPSVTQPLTVMRDISTQRNVPKAEPEPDILTDVNPQGIRSGIDYTARAQPKSAERQYLDTVEDMRAKRDAETALEPIANDVYDTDALMRQNSGKAKYDQVRMDVLAKLNRIKENQALARERVERAKEEAKYNDEEAEYEEPMPEEIYQPVYDPTNPGRVDVYGQMRRGGMLGRGGSFGVFRK
jgi:hypothetical protein